MRDQLHGRVAGKNHRMYDVALACRLSRYRESISIKWVVTKKGRISDQMSDTEMSGETRTGRSMLRRNHWIHRECREVKAHRRGSSRHEDVEGLSKEMKREKKQDEQGENGCARMI